MGAKQSRQGLHLLVNDSLQLAARNFLLFGWRGQRFNRAACACPAGLCLGSPILLEGPPGSGKSALIEHVAALTGNAQGQGHRRRRLSCFNHPHWLGAPLLCPARGCACKGAVMVLACFTALL
jgi:hypothetical protein